MMVVVMMPPTVMVMVIIAVICAGSPRMSAMGQTRSFGDVGSMSDLPKSGHGAAIYEYTP